VSKYNSRQELQDAAGREGGPARFIFGCGLEPGFGCGCGLQPEDLPDGTPGNVIAAVTRLTTRAAADLETFRAWLDAPAGGPDA
jgi:hypothetical protein